MRREDEAPLPVVRRLTLRESFVTAQAWISFARAMLVEFDEAQADLIAADADRNDCGAEKEQPACKRHLSSDSCNDATAIAHNPSQGKSNN